MGLRRALNSIPMRLRSLFRRDSVERDLDDELRDHLERKAEQYRSSGLSAEEARRSALRDLEGFELRKEQCRDTRRVRPIEDLLQDLRYSLRSLRKAPGFAVVAILTLALGIGANAAIFSALNTILLRPLPLKDPDRLIFSVALREGIDPYGTSLLEYQAFRDRSRSYESMGIALRQSFNLIERGQPEQVQGATVQLAFLDTLGVSPVIGRAFSAEEDRPGGPAVALLGFGLWKRRFGGDPSVIGRSLNLAGRSTTVIGVLPPAFDLPNQTEIWLPYQRDIAGLPLAERLAHNHALVGRLKPGVSLRQADLEMKQITRQLEREYPRERHGWSAEAIWLRQELIGDLNRRTEKALLLLTGAVGFLLLICCGNVASLLLARGVARERELTMRRALGADWVRLIRQLLTESAVLAILGAGAGLLLAYSILPLLRSLNPINMIGFVGLLTDIRIDQRVLAFVALATLLTAVLCALTPIVRAAGSNNLMPALKEGGSRGTAGSSGRRWLSVLVTVQIAIAVPLLVGGGLLIQSFRHLQRFELGFKPDHLLAMHVDPSPTKYAEFPKREAFVRQVLLHVKEIPGVVSAGMTTNMPLVIFSRDVPVSVEGHSPANLSDVPATSHRLVTPEYLQTLGVTLVKGRLLDEHDRANGSPVVVITEDLAQQGWAGEDPIGKHVKWIRPGEQDSNWLTVVGVVKNVSEDRDDFRIGHPAWYLPYEQNQNSYSLDLVVRTAGDPAALASAVTGAVHDVDSEQAVSRIITMDEHVARVTATERFSAVLMGALAALGLTLAVIGLYGVMAYSVSRETRELGLRVALGATPGGILGMVVGRGLRLIAAGLLLGLVAAAAVTRFLSGALYRVSPHDPATFAFVTGLLALVALAACYVPARRATRVDPMVTLRYE